MKQKICENCKSNLTFSVCYDHILKLSDYTIGPDQYAVIDVFIMPILEEPLFFCGMGCLKKWIEKTI